MVYLVNSTHAHYNSSLDDALNQFRTLLSTWNSKSWKPIPSATAANTTAHGPVYNSTASQTSTTTAVGSSSLTSTSITSNPLSSGDHPSTTTSRPTRQQKDNLVNGIGPVDATNVQVHKRSIKGQADVVRAIAEVPVLTHPMTGEPLIDLESFKAVLQTVEVRNACE